MADAVLGEPDGRVREGRLRMLDETMLIIGPSRTNYMVLSGDRIDAQTHRFPRHIF
jgi:hypothetical protein